jgi:HAD superfamily hydrolase (TIGR01509 family)
MPAFMAILWDNDGVLVDTEHLYCEATRQVFAGAGIALEDDDYRSMFLTGNMGAWHLLAAQGRPDAEIARLREERNEIYSALLRGRDHAVDGVKEVLQALHGRYAMGVVTSSRRDHFAIIHSTSGLLHYFDFVLTREQYANAKPDPEPYLAGIAKIGFSAAQCLAVEDTPRGLIAATRAGLKCVVIPNALTAGGDFSAAYKVLTDIRELPSVLSPRV